MKLIKTKSYEGYYIKDIKKKHGEIGFRTFQKWFVGQTGAIYKGKLVVYKYDYERFLEGLPPFD